MERERTHVYGPGVPAEPGQLPGCGCSDPEWLDPADVRGGCANCGRGMAEILCCDGSDQSEHWHLFLAKMLVFRRELARATAAQQACQADFDRQHGYTAASKERRLRTLIERAQEAVRVGAIPSKSCIKTTPSDAKLEDRARDLRSAERHIERAISYIAALRGECVMCTARWDREHPGERF